MNLNRTRAERSERLSPASLRPQELTSLAQALRAEKPYLDSGRNGVTLVKTPELRVVLEALRAGAGIAEHVAPGTETLHVLEGVLRYCAGGEEVSLSAGELLAFPGQVRHRVTAEADSLFLLTIAPNQE